MSVELILDNEIRDRIREAGDVPSEISVTRYNLASLWDSPDFYWEQVALGGHKLYYYKGIQLRVTDV